MAHTPTRAAWVALLILGCGDAVEGGSSPGLGTEETSGGAATRSPPSEAANTPSAGPNAGVVPGAGSQGVPPAGAPIGPGPSGPAPVAPNPVGDAPGAGQSFSPDSVEGLPPRALPLGPGGFYNLAPERAEPFDRVQGAALDPPPPPGWNWHPVEGTSCRDGSEAGLFLRSTESSRLLIVFEGGGACTTAGFCGFNPKNVNEVLFGNGETVLGTALGAVPGRQQPGAYTNGELQGIFSTERTENPFQNWNIAYIPYCTGDVHFGTREAARVPGVPEPQKFVGFFNTQKFVGRLASTFEAGLEQVVVTGMSAGSFGAALNFSMISDAFPGVQTDAVLDSGIPFEDAFWSVCQQASWRALFGFDYAMPPDCEECFQEDGAGMLGLTDFLMRKHPSSRFALISSMQDEVIRLFFTPGENECSTIETADPVGITLGQIAGGQLYPGEKYESALLSVRAKYSSSGNQASYFFAGPNVTLHQHSMRRRFFEPLVGGQSMAQFVSSFLDGEMRQVGP